MEESVYLTQLKVVGWRLVKGGIDYSLFDQTGVFMCTVKILSRLKPKASPKKQLAPFQGTFGSVSQATEELLE